MNTLEGYDARREGVIFGPQADTVNGNSQRAQDDKRWKELSYLLTSVRY